MREIKFRAWDKENKTMVNVEGLQFNMQGELECVVTDDRQEYGIVYFEVMQYTGLKDKNGKEIYEGDICKIPTGYTYEVKMTLFSLGYKGSGSYGYHQYEKCEVIGNIYEETK